jgi:hypothetical protein
MLGSEQTEIIPVPASGTRTPFLDRVAGSSCEGLFSPACCLGSPNTGIDYNTRMLDVFLSYSRSDETFAVDLSQELQKRQWDVWRDQDSLRAGDRWPKLLGEAIASRVFFVLLWSTEAASSDFVELEWTIAIAMRRRMGILMLDPTPLPPTLSPYEARHPSSAKQAAKWLGGASFGLPSKFYAKQAEMTLREIGVTPESEPRALSARLRLTIGLISAGCSVGCSGVGSRSRTIPFLS